MALVPLADELGAGLVVADEVLPGDVPLLWDDELVGGFRLPGLAGALDRLLAAIAREVGPLHELDREGKQQVVHRLAELGAFNLRKAAEDVADALGVSRFTIYNYLTAVGGNGG